MRWKKKSPRLEFTETPLSEVLDYIESTSEIPIQIWVDKKGTRRCRARYRYAGHDQPGRDQAASGLKIMLKELELTYVISDEVLKITTPEEADSQLLTKVYPVADLVMPIISGGGMGGMMGGMGGGMGGMGGGMGRHGRHGGGMGGMGGGMGGMGGMGGFFDVEDTLQLGTKPTPRKPKLPANAAQPVPQGSHGRCGREVGRTDRSRERKEGQSKAEAWDAYFRRRTWGQPRKGDGVGRSDPGHGQGLADQEAYADIVTMLQSAIRHSLAQPWMYHPLSLALMATDAPQTEVERR